jgi:starch phosphorylase
MSISISVALFSFEVGLTAAMPNYAGGLGILTGDMLKSAADLNLDVVGVSLLYSQGVFQQKIDTQGHQTEFYLDWNPEPLLVLRTETITLHLEQRPVKVKLWEYQLPRQDGKTNSIYFLDTNCPENHPEDRLITSELYPSNKELWLKQQILLGIGGVQALHALGYPVFANYHLNESHDMFVLIELHKLFGNWQEVKKRAVTTIHTPLPEAHRAIRISHLKKLLDHSYHHLFDDPFFRHDQFNQTEFAIHFSKYANGVAIKHGNTTQKTYPNYQIDAITNGVHPQTWANPHLQKLFDEYLPNWQFNPNVLRLVHKIPPSLLWQAHKQAKRDLINLVYQTTGQTLDSEVFTIGFARRKVAYKRPNFIFSKIDKLNQIAEKYSGLQLVFAGKAWYNDLEGKKLLKQMFQHKAKLSSKIQLVFIPNYNMSVAAKMVAGVDLWLNNPIIPLEASGTSGMKANLNGVPNFSVLDGWWLEGWLEGITGWAIGDESGDVEKEIFDLYHKLETVILPTYYEQTQWIQIAANCIGINASQFNTHRVMSDYLTKAYNKVFQENSYLETNPQLVSVLENTVVI